jgi:predicted nuclease with TOPRIM domain
MILKYSEQGQPYEDGIAENKKLKDRVKELDNSLSIALNNIDRYQRENKDLGEKCKEAGRVMIELNAKYETSLKEVDRLLNYHVKIMKDDGKSTSNDS